MTTPTTPEAALAAALTDMQGGAYASWLKRAPLVLAALDGWTLVRRDDLRRWNVSHGNTCYATTLGPDARCTCGLSAALAVVLVIVEKP